MAENKIPVHVSIIMDGNGRWARQQGKERLFGHYAGTESVRACCEFAARNGIKYLSLFAFSQENWNRPQSEVSGLMKLMFKSLLDEIDNFMENHIRFRVIGDRSQLSEKLLECIVDAEKKTESNDGLTLILMLSYSGQWDIVQAAARYAEDVKSGVLTTPLTPELFAQYLSTAGIPDPDLLIRTSGEQRISNYMLWQCSYSEFYYTDVLWPDFREAEFAKAIESYSSRDRRYGKVK